MVGTATRRPFSWDTSSERIGGRLLPARVEDYVAVDAPVWVIEAFVDGLDFFRAAGYETG
jgi:hypothetical protein